MVDYQTRSRETSALQGLEGGALVSPVRDSPRRIRGDRRIPNRSRLLDLRETTPSRKARTVHTDLDHDAMDSACKLGRDGSPRQTVRLSGSRRRQTHTSEGET